MGYPLPLQQQKQRLDKGTTVVKVRIDVLGLNDLHKILHDVESFKPKLKYEKSPNEWCYECGGQEFLYVEYERPMTDQERQTACKTPKYVPLWKKNMKKASSSR